ncbi:MAG: glycosyltransferase [Opitutaceae bacterium]|nr:glycosyltransferase [Opitutaceae bacterium]
MLISVLMPVRNARATVARAVASIRRQSCPDWELVAVDDGSDDGTRDWLREEARREPRLRLVEQPAAGIVAALERGRSECRGGLIARMDADDEAHPERLAEQRALLVARPEVGVASCLVEHGGERRTQAGYARHVDWLNSLLTPEQLALNRFVESPVAHPSVMFRSELAGRLGGYRSGDFPEDYELWLRWMDAGVRMAKVARPLLTWHDPPGRLSRTDARYSPEAFFRLKAAWIAREVGRLPGPARPVLVWGAGRPTRKRAAHLPEHGLGIAGYVDIDPRKIGRKVNDLPVLAPRELPPPARAVVLGYVASRGARELIRADLAGRGYREGRDFLLCA